MEFTRKYVNSAYKNVISINYCQAQSLLHYRFSNGYTEGIYGWNADVYQVRIDTVIVTGYRPFGNIKPNYELVRSYNDRAETISHSKLTYDEKKEETEKLLVEFVNKCLNK